MERELRGSLLEKKRKDSCCPNMTPFVLMLALSVHSIFEGLALGLAKTESAVINMVIAICFHKFAASASLGISLVKSFPDDFKMIRWLLFMFAIATPIGVLLGMALAKTSEVVEIIFNSIAAGTFLYIACSEMIVEEFSIPGYRYWKLLAFLIGAGFILCLFWIEED